LFVARRPEFSAQTLAVLAVLAAQPSDWQHGYAIARDTGLKSGTLYPILIRLADRGLMEARWEDEQPAGRPRRHLYRLTPQGLTRAGAALQAVRPRAAPSHARAAPSPGRTSPAQALIQ
jgi:PadR family transcriptional regulator PadR